MARYEGGSRRYTVPSRSRGFTPTAEQLALLNQAKALKGQNFTMQEQMNAYEAIRRGIADPQAVLSAATQAAPMGVTPSREEYVRQLRERADAIKTRLRDPNRGPRPAPSPFGGQFNDYIQNLRPVDLTSQGNWGKYKDSRFQGDLVNMMKEALGPDYDKYFGGTASVPEEFKYSTRWGVPSDIAASKAGNLYFKRDPRSGLANYAQQGMAGWNQFLKDYDTMKNFSLGPGNWQLAWNTTYGGQDDAGKAFKALSAQGFWDEAAGNFVDLPPWMQGMSPQALQAYAGNNFGGHYFGTPGRRRLPSQGGGGSSGMFQYDPFNYQGARRVDAWQAQPSTTMNRRRMLET